MPLAYYWGDSSDGLKERENILDESTGPDAPMPPAEWDDGYPWHAPIGSLASNGFGLHDVLGNVSEWCQDAYLQDPLSGPSPINDESPGIPLRSIRGGCWYYPPTAASLEPNRCAFRQMDGERAVSPARGLRVVRDCKSPKR